MRLVGRKTTEAAIPVPERGRVWLPVLALSVRAIVPGRTPVAVGVNVTVKVQLCPVLRLEPQVLVCE